MKTKWKKFKTDYSKQKREIFQDLGQYTRIMGNVSEDIYQEYNNNIFVPLREIRKIYDEIMNKQIFS